MQETGISQTTIWKMLRDDGRPKHVRLQTHPRTGESTCFIRAMLALNDAAFPFGTVITDTSAEDEEDGVTIVVAGCKQDPSD